MYSKERSKVLRMGSTPRITKCSMERGIYLNATPHNKRLPADGSKMTHVIRRRAGTSTIVQLVEKKDEAQSQRLKGFVDVYPTK